ncbi:MAG: hypothetical protein JWR59_2408 [Brevundimonas sp.]|nr:hypothetical protein [Brevundimonas sp.]
MESPLNTCDAIAASETGARNSPAAERNAEVILRVLAAHLPARGRVLEIASGSGQHAVAFAGILPDIDWTPSDPSAEARESIAAWTEAAALPNLAPALAIDAAAAETWPDSQFDALVCINMIHISPWAATQGLMAGAARVLANPGGLLALYGPYREADVALAPSNAAFDASLKARDPAWGLRDRDEVVALAKTHGLRLTLRLDMPANNIMLLFRRA